jgi:2-keto-4-pentenoate hydratase/2-oxohepta-3-ene-1,7-dioic acid hydratase in catechol pathway
VGWGKHMRLASYDLRGRPSFGAVIDVSVIGLRSRLTRFATLLGEVIAAGTPAKKGPEAEPPVWLEAGDTVVERPGIGVLCNSVADAT